MRLTQLQRLIMDVMIDHGEPITRTEIRRVLRNRFSFNRINYEVRNAWYKIMIRETEFIWKRSRYVLTERGLDEVENTEQQHELTSTMKILD